MAAEADTLEQQQPKTPTGMLDMESLDAFLSEMDSLSDNEEGLAKRYKPLRMAPVDAAAATSGFMQPNAKKKKKLSTLQRTRREKALLLDEIGSMEQQLERMRREHCEKIAPIYAKRWQPVIMEEERRRTEQEAEQLRLWKRVQIEELKVQALLDLIEQMRSMVMQASCHPFASFQHQTVCDHDTAIVDVLAWNVAAKYEKLDFDMLPSTNPTREVAFGRLAADGTGVDYEFVHLAPFGVQMISEIGWDCAKSDFGTNYSGLLKKIYAEDTQALKQELMVAIPNHKDVKLKILAVCKQFKNERRTVVVWEGLSQWLAPTGETIASTHEQGSIIIEPCTDDSCVSIAKGFVQLKPISSGSRWLSLVPSTSALSTVVLPSYQIVMDTRHRYVENRILDTNRSISQTPSVTV